MAGGITDLLTLFVDMETFTEVQMKDFTSGVRSRISPPDKIKQAAMEGLSDTSKILSCYFILPIIFLLILVLVIIVMTGIINAITAFLILIGMLLFLFLVFAITTSAFVKVGNRSSERLKSACVDYIEQSSAELINGIKSEAHAYVKGKSSDIKTSRQKRTELKEIDELEIMD